MEPEYRRVLASVRASKPPSVDETGWRVGGRPARLHVWVGDEATGYAINSHRRADAREQVIGIDWSGVLSHDGFASYDRFGHPIHPSCLAHVLRRAGAVGRRHAGSGRVPAPVDRLVHRGDPPAQPVGRPGGGGRGARQRSELDDRLLALVRARRAVPACATRAKHLHRHPEQWFTFVFDPSVAPTDWKAEQAIRPAVVSREVWGGNRTRAGADAQGGLMSVFETCRRPARSARDFVSAHLRAWGNRLLQGPTLLPGR